VGEQGIFSATAVALHHLVGIVCLCILAMAGKGLAAVDAPWQRASPVGIPDGDCQELAVGRAGHRFLELRMAAEPLPSDESSRTSCAG